ncbi:MAG: ABC transporter substrate-binding protein [Propionicimonas sp.]
MSRTMNSLAIGGAVAVVATLALSGCSTPTTGGPGTSAPTGPTEGAQASAVTICTSKSNGVFDFLAEKYNAQSDGVTLKATELGTNADETRTQMIQRLEGGSSDCDIYMLDGTWVGEWAPQKWILDLGEVGKDVSENLFPSVFASGQYDGTQWAIPFYTNAGLLYYRTDRVPEPTSWQQIYKVAAESPDNRTMQQLMPYEGLTVNFLEILYSNGGSVLDDSGKVVVNSPEALEALELMVQSMKNGAIDRASLTYDEASSRMAFESGQGGYLRGWPSAFGGIQESKIADQVGVASLPAFKDGTTPTPVLGGWNMAIGAASKNPEAAADVIRFAVSPEFQKQMFIDFLQAPVVPAVYDDAAVQEAIPTAQKIKAAVGAARPRPATPVYAQVSRAIYENVYEALQGNLSAEEALTKMAADIETAQATF